MAKQAAIKKDDLPPDWSWESADFINKLLQRKPANRLGLRGAAEAKEHSWFKLFNWKDLYLRNLPSPFLPKIGDNFAYKYCNAQDKIGVNTQERYYAITNNIKYKDLFFEFLPFNREAKSKNHNVITVTIINPHLVYLEDELKKSVPSHSLTSSLHQKSFVASKNRYGLETDKYATLRRYPSSSSSTVLLRGYKSAV